MKEEGLQVLGALFWEFEADAIVNIDLKLHQQYVAQRDFRASRSARHRGNDP